MHTMLRVLCEPFLLVISDRNKFINKSVLCINEEIIQCKLFYHRKSLSLPLKSFGQAAELGNTHVLANEKYNFYL